MAEITGEREHGGEGSILQKEREELEEGEEGKEERKVRMENFRSGVPYRYQHASR